MSKQAAREDWACFNPVRGMKRLTTVERNSSACDVHMTASYLRPPMMRCRLRPRLEAGPLITTKGVRALNPNAPNMMLFRLSRLKP